MRGVPLGVLVTAAVLAACSPNGGQAPDTTLPGPTLHFGDTSGPEALSGATMRVERTTPACLRIHVTAASAAEFDYHLTDLTARTVSGEVYGPRITADTEIVAQTVPPGGSLDTRACFPAPFTAVSYDAQKSYGGPTWRD